MSTIQSENKMHQSVANASEATRQTEAAKAKAAYDGSPAAYPAYDAAVKAADAAHFRRIIASCEANGIHAGVFRHGLWELTGQRS
jgi:hypothetical protein